MGNHSTTSSTPLPGSAAFAHLPSRKQQQLLERAAQEALCMLARLKIAEKKWKEAKSMLRKAEDLNRSERISDGIFSDGSNSHNAVSEIRSRLPHLEAAYKVFAAPALMTIFPPTNAKPVLSWIGHSVISLNRRKTLLLGRPFRRAHDPFESTATAFEIVQAEQDDKFETHIREIPDSNLGFMWGHATTVLGTDTALCCGGLDHDVPTTHCWYIHWPSAISNSALDGGAPPAAANPSFTLIRHIKGPSARAWHSCVRLSDRRILVFGGQTHRDVASNDLYIADLDIAQKVLTWRRVAVVDDEHRRPVTLAGRSHHSACLANDRLYIFGGLSERRKPLNSLLMLDLDRLRDTTDVTPVVTLVRERDTVLQPAERYDHAAVVWQSRYMIICGGTGRKGATYGDMWMFDTLTKVWVEREMRMDDDGERFGKRSLHAIMIRKEWEYLPVERLFLVGGLSGDATPVTLGDVVAVRLVRKDDRVFDPQVFDVEHAPLGGGGIGCVSKAVHSKTGHTVAVKMLHPCGPESEFDRSAEFEKQHELLKRCQHPHLVPYLGCCDFVDNQRRCLWLVFEYCEKHSLEKHADAIKRSPREMYRIALGTARGLAYLHSLKLIHRDIKAQNILLKKDGTALLADFDKIRLVGPQMTDRTGTPNWMAPEVASRQSYSTSADMWSFGLLLYFLITGEQPLQHCMTLDTLRAEASRCPGQLSTAIKAKCPILLPSVQELQTLMEACVTPNPLHRPSAAQMVRYLEEIWLKHMNAHPAERPLARGADEPAPPIPLPLNVDVSELIAQFGHGQSETESFYSCLVHLGFCFSNSEAEAMVKHVIPILAASEQIGSAEAILHLLETDVEDYKEQLASLAFDVTIVVTTATSTLTYGDDDSGSGDDELFEDKAAPVAGPADPVVISAAAGTGSAKNTPVLPLPMPMSLPVRDAKPQKRIATLVKDLCRMDEEQVIRYWVVTQQDAIAE